MHNVGVSYEWIIVGARRGSVWIDSNTIIHTNGSTTALKPNVERNLLVLSTKSVKTRRLFNDNGETHPYVHQMISLIS